MWLLISYVTPRKTADGPLGSGGRSAQLTSRYITSLWDPPVISSFLLLTSTRDKLRSCSRAAVAPFRRSPSSGHHTSIPHASTFPSTSSTFPNPQPGFSPAGIAPATTGHHWSRLKLCSTVDPLLRSSSARTDLGNGIVVSHLCPLASFPLPLCAADAGEPPSPPPPCLLPPVGWSAKVNRGQSA